MGKYDHYIKAFEESKLQMDNFVMAEKLGEYRMPSSIKSCINEALNGIDRGYSKLIEIVVNDEISATNQILSNNPYSMHCDCIIANHNYNGSCTINCFDKKFYFKNFDRCTFDNFMIEWSAMKEYAQNMALLISKNLKAYKPVIEQAFAELNDKFKMTSNRNLKGNISTPGNPYTYIRVTISDREVQYAVSIDLTKEVKDWDATKEEIAKLFENGFEYQTEMAKKENIKKYVHKICDKYDIPHFEPNYKKEMPSFYNLKEGWVDISIPLKNIEVMQKFEFELRNTAIMIMELAHIVKDWQISAKISYNIGSKMYFVFKAEKVIDGKTYLVYDSGIGNKKTILHVFCDGQMLSGNERKRAIKALGYGKAAKTPWQVYEYQHNRYIIPQGCRERIIKKLNEKYNAGLV
jgi:hypothetical protein